MAVDTGYIEYKPGNNEYAPGANVIERPPTVRGCILFDHLSHVDQPLSPIIDVEPGDVVLIDAYGISLGLELSVNRVLKAGYDPLSYESACNRHDVPLSRMFEIFQSKRMALGPKGEAGWTLTEDQTQLLIALPGSYQLECNIDPVPTDVLYVTYQKWNQYKLPQLPVAYQAGV